jgi:hypothetical protein
LRLTSGARARRVEHAAARFRVGLLDGRRDATSG